MSVCVVAVYPWKTIESCAGLSTPGVVICSDTRVTYDNGRSIGPWLIAKQQLLARNILICYTSSHVAATSLALHACAGTRQVKRIGEALRNAHGRYGGLTEMIAIVWRGRSVPEVLELMPPAYQSHRRTGIIGLGDPEVLSWFHTHFADDLNVPKPPPDLDKMAAAWERQFGTRFELPPPSLPIETAANHVGAALSSGILEVGGPTVGLPIQLMTIAEGQVQQLHMVSSSDLKSWEDFTIPHNRTRLAPPVPTQAPRTQQRRTAHQLFP